MRQPRMHICTVQRYDYTKISVHNVCHLQSIRVTYTTFALSWSYKTCE